LHSSDFGENIIYQVWAFRIDYPILKVVVVIHKSEEFHPPIQTPSLSWKGIAASYIDAISWMTWTVFTNFHRLDHQFQSVIRYFPVVIIVGKQLIPAGPAAY